jgi:hypothetical protein
MATRSPEDRRRMQSTMDRLGDNSPWSEYRRLVLSELERINDTLDKIQRDLSGIKTEVEILKFKASVWGVAAGGVSGAVVAMGAVFLRVG